MWSRICRTLLLTLILAVAVSPMNTSTTTVAPPTILQSRVEPHSDEISFGIAGCGGILFVVVLGRCWASTRSSNVDEENALIT